MCVCARVCVCVYVCCVYVSVCACACACVCACTYTLHVCVCTCMCCDTSSVVGECGCLAQCSVVTIAKQWGPGNTWKVGTKLYTSHIMWHVQPSFELIVLSPAGVLYRVNKVVLRTWPLQTFVYAYMCTMCMCLHVCSRQSPRTNFIFVVIINVARFVCCL